MTGAGGRSRPAVGRGFTLLEILVVLAILAIAATVGFATLTGDDRGALEREARRFAGAVEYASQRAQLRHETLGVSAPGDRWRFWRRANDGSWLALAGDDALAERSLPSPLSAAAVSYAGRAIPPESVVPLRANGRNEPFAFVLRAGVFEAKVNADPLNRVAIAGPQRVDR